tara:strand:+ start:373 stop:963 length:591 start_codon:yes stop_codon:yes gene_type:complete
MASLFQDILDSKPEELEAKSIDSLQWFQSNIRDIRRTPTVVMKEAQNFVTRFDLGRMYMYMYMPKGMGKLPYYDLFPLTVVLKRYATGFLGFNMHYIAPRYRVLLMDYLYEVQEESQEDTQFRVRYPDVKSISRLRWARPCIKQYQYPYINSRIVEVKPEHMDFVTMMPNHMFRKGKNMQKFNALDVYRDSQKVHG